MKKLAYALVLTGLVAAPTLAMAEEESPHSLSANVTLTSDYIFRGISQTGGDPAIQGGLDYSHKSGFYLGTWASNVGWIEDFQGYESGNMEIDLYGGFHYLDEHFTGYSGAGTTSQANGLPTMNTLMSGGYQLSDRDIDLYLDWSNTGARTDPYATPYMFLPESSTEID